MVASVVKEEPLGMDDVLHILDEASQVIAYSRQLEQKSRALETATAELRAANARLQELDRLKDDFISTVTHELRTPLTSIRAMAEILQSRSDLDAARRAHFVSVIVKESERLTRLINQVLDLAKLESGAADWHSSDVDLRALIEDAAASTAAMLRERGVRLTMELPEAVPTVRSDRDRLMQVLLNLLSNAAKFCPSSDGEVTVRLTERPTELQVDVIDNGVGIDAADHESIFEKFRQVGDTLTDKPQGTGLGLPISRQIIQHLGGRLWVDSALGKGATFSFTLPLDPKPGQATRPDFRGGRDPIMSKSILIADDEPNIVLSLEFLLQEAGYQVRVARDGHEALQALEQQVPELILLDVMLPRVSGFDVCQRIRDNPAWSEHAGRHAQRQGARGRGQQGPRPGCRRLRHQAVRDQGLDGRGSETVGRATAGVKCRSPGALRSPLAGLPAGWLLAGGGPAPPEQADPCAGALRSGSGLRRSRC